MNGSPVCAWVLVAQFSHVLFICSHISLNEYLVRVSVRSDLKNDQPLLSLLLLLLVFISLNH